MRFFLEKKLRTQACLHACAHKCKLNTCFHQQSRNTAMMVATHVSQNKAKRTRCAAPLILFCFFASSVCCARCLSNIRRLMSRCLIIDDATASIHAVSKTKVRPHSASAHLRQTQKTPLLPSWPAATMQDAPSSGIAPFLAHQEVSSHLENISTQTAIAVPQPCHV